MAGSSGEGVTRVLAPLDEGARLLADRMSSVHIDRIRELPRIELYLDQVLTLVTDELSFMLMPGETALTGSMVNNYVKQGVVPPPVKKRYTRRHVGTLLFVCAFKRVFTIAQVSQIMRAINESDANLAVLYDSLCDALERALAEWFSGKGGELPPVSPHVRLVDDRGDALAPELAMLLDSSVVSLASKVYVEQTLALRAAHGGSGSMRRR